MDNTLAVDIGGTQVKWAIVDEDYGTPERGSPKTDFSSADELIAAVVRLVRKHASGVGGVALSVPGTILEQDPTGTVIGGGALRYMDGCPLGQRVGDASVLPVVVMNDGKSCALGEYAMGALRGCRVGVAMAIGTGLGGGIVFDGRVLAGAHGFAGEFSFLPTSYDHGLDIRYATALSMGWKGLRDDVCREKELPDAEREATDGRAVFEWVNAGDTAARRGLDTYTRRLATLLFSLQATVDPDVFALGGGISAQPALLASLRANIDAMYEPWPLKQLPKPNVVLAQHGNDANLFGATYELRRRTAAQA